MDEVGAQVLRDPVSEKRGKVTSVFPIMRVTSGRYSARQARQFMEKMSECAVGCDSSGGKV